MTAAASDGGGAINPAHLAPLPAEAGRDGLAGENVHSIALRRQVVRDTFGTFLGRQPTVTELNFWVGELAPGQTRREDFDGALASSQEYYDRNSDGG